MKKLVLIALTLATAFAVEAQDDKNLITNPGFEAGDGKLKKVKQIDKATNWESPTGSKADYFSRMKQGLPISVPSNLYGKEEPLEGDHYAGIIAYSYNNKEPRTYLQTELLGPLTKGKQYCVKFNVSLADLSKYSCNNLGAHLTKERIELEDKADIIFENDKVISKLVLHPENNTFDGRFNWETICNVFTADGKETYVVIGNFHNNKDTKMKKLKKDPDFKGTQVPKAYYYIDQVEVFVLDSIEECMCGNKEMSDDFTRVMYHKQITSEGDLSVEQKIKYATIYFDFTKDKIDPSMVQDLKNVADLLKADAGLKLEIQGNTGDEEALKAKSNQYYKDLAMRRANKVQEYLIEQGAPAGQLSVVSNDATKLASDGGEEIDKAKNRRVEFKIQ